MKTISNGEVIGEEEKYDGYYAVAANLDYLTVDIIKVSSKYYKTENCFYT